MRGRSTSGGESDNERLPRPSRPLPGRPLAPRLPTEADRDGQGRERAAHFDLSLRLRGDGVDGRRRTLRFQVLYPLRGHRPPRPRDSALPVVLGDGGRKADNGPALPRPRADEAAVEAVGPTSQAG